ncbi:putative oligosaccharyltransferase complex subunit CG9662 [Teleopsis dalmanni]|uniref:putative oligosaccharyltransferase complex subunit CG9662 n=1 Tax=Teleopsis dalmanni TaxID=139649 RepID=UPI000D32BF1D|nr:putative oligosaccharyltransferase complex subunit CG9662 [Teleopsis dalmanni]XP_037959701.1 putative oligosaccharyltransferase complex subunit CG9662 [Teleopsis dalmanni]
MLEEAFTWQFNIIAPPNLKLRTPTWFHLPHPMTIFSFVLLSYFLVTGGVIYDIIVEPPSVGATVDENGHSRPVAFMPYRVNGQYIMEGLAASFLFTIGSLGFIIMDHNHVPGKSNLNRALLSAMGFIFIIVSFFTTWLFMRMKLPSYLLG